MKNQQLKNKIAILQAEITDIQSNIARYKTAWHEQALPHFLIPYSLIASFLISFCYTRYQLTIDPKKWQKFASLVLTPLWYVWKIWKRKSTKQAPFLLD